MYFKSATLFRAQQRFNSAFGSQEHFYGQRAAGGKHLFAEDKVNGYRRIVINHGCIDSGVWPVIVLAKLAVNSAKIKGCILEA